MPARRHRAARVAVALWMLAGVAAPGGPVAASEVVDEAAGEGRSDAADGPAPAAASETKRRALASIDRQAPDVIRMADRIWELAETALRETRSAALLADYAEARGFAVERGVAELPTAFVASYGSGPPVIGILGEYDALPGLSQKPQPSREPLEEGAPGHGCGHNLLGPASLAAAVAIQERIAAGELPGTVRFYGTPAEEDVGGKLYMLRAGLFDDLDVAIAWHPSDEIAADTEGSQAIVDFLVEFHGRAAHAAADPWNGRSALDGVELFTHGINLMREHVRPTVRMHYVVSAGGDVPNVVPEYASVWCWIRDSTHVAVEELLERARAIAEGAALASGTESELRIQTGDYEMLVNLEGAKLIHENLTWLGPLAFSEEEQEFARAIQRATGVEPLGLKGEVEPLELEPGPPEGGSSDVADVSWKVPTLHLSVTTAAYEAPWHAWPVVTTGGSSIGHKGMIHAAKALAATLVDLYEDPARRQAIEREFREKTADFEFRLWIPGGPPPVPAD